MATIPIAAALRVIPWKTLLAQAPTIIDGANTLVGKFGEMRQAPRKERVELAARLEDMENRLNALERDQTAQAELSKGIAIQLEGVTESLRIVAARAWIAIVVSAGVAVLTLVIGIWALTRAS